MAKKREKNASSGRRGRGKGRPFQKGNTAAVGHGRPPKPTIFNEFLDVVVKGEDPNTGEPVEISRRENMMLAAYDVATNKRHPYFGKMQEMVWAYDLGRPRDRVELTGADGQPIKHEDVIDTDRLTTGGLRKRLAELEAVAAARKRGSSSEKPEQ